VPELDPTLKADAYRFYQLYQEKVQRRAIALYRATLTHGQFYVLLLVHMRGSMPLRELAERATMQKQQITKLVNQLEEMGYVQRVKGVHQGRRVNILQETPQGAAFFDGLSQSSEQFLQTLLGELPPQRRAEVQQALRTLCDLLEPLP